MNQGSGKGTVIETNRDGLSPDSCVEAVRVVPSGLAAGTHPLYVLTKLEDVVALLAEKELHFLGVHSAGVQVGSTGVE